MVKRLGTVLFAAGIIAAAVCGAIGYALGADGQPQMIVLQYWGAGGAALVAGWACRYVLSGD